MTPEHFKKLTEESSKYDCRTCNGCCHVYGDQGVEIIEDDFNVVPLELTELDENGLRWMKHNPETGSCIALVGGPGVPGSCSIYDKRPISCREFMAGTAVCLRIRDILKNINTKK